MPGAGVFQYIIVIVMVMIKMRDVIRDVFQYINLIVMVMRDFNR